LAGPVSVSWVGAGAAEAAGTASSRPAAVNGSPAHALTSRPRTVIFHIVSPIGRKALRLQPDIQALTGDA
jgi:hypothetical protein